MLQLFRNSGRHWAGKALTTLLFGLLILSFGIWGVADWLNNPSVNTVATVGERTVSAQDMREAYLNQLQALQRQTRTPISAEQAQAMGLDRQVLAQLVGQAALDSSADKLKLAVSDSDIAAIVMREPQFQTSSGDFNRPAFEAALQNAGLTEQAFVNDQRTAIPRRQLAESLAGDIAPIPAMQDAIHRFSTERRSVRHVTLAPQAAGAIADPDDRALETWFEERKSLFRQPELRAFSYLALTPETLAKPEAVTPDAARARYEADKTRLYGTPETRHVQQLVFQNEAEAAQIHARLTGTENGGNAAALDGAFAAIAAERKVAEADYDLGLVTRDAVFDPAVAEAAFALDAPGVTAPVKGRFGTVIARVVSITPASVQSFEEVEQAVRLAVAVDAARATVDSLHDRIEDARAAARPLSDIATELGQAVQSVQAVDRNGRDRDGKPAGEIPNGANVLAAVFTSDVGADNAPLRIQTSTGPGYVWFDVTDVVPERDLAFTEVRERALTLWRQDATADKLSALARDIAARVDKGEAFDAVVASLPEGAVIAPPATTADVVRNGGEALPAAAASQIFATHKGKAGSATVTDGRLIFQVTDVTVPDATASPEATAAVARQLRTVLADDLLAEYVAYLQTQLRPTYNEQALRTAIGSGGGQ